MMRLLMAATMIAGLAAATPAVALPCFPDDSIVTVKGIVQEVYSRDKHTGKLFSYFVILSTETYCVFGNLVPVGQEPTSTLALSPRPNEIAKYRSFVGYPVTFTGRLGSTNSIHAELFDGTLHKDRASWTP